MSSILIDILFISNLHKICEKNRRNSTKKEAQTFSISLEFSNKNITLMSPLASISGVAGSFAYIDL